MKTDVETLSPTRVRLTVEASFEDLEGDLASAYRKVAQQVQVPGFRPGKVPPKIIDQRFGRGVVLNEAVNDAVPRLYGQAVEDQGVEALSQPELEVTKLEDGDELAFTAEVDVRPEIEVPEYDDLSVTVDDAEVSPDDVEEELTTLRERFASLGATQRPAQDGDYVSIDLSATVDGEPLEDAQASGMSYEVGQGSLIDGLDEALRGMSADESTTFSTDLVGERAGQQAEVTVTVHSVKEKDLPELDDEFAQLASEFDTIGELRADLRSRLEQSKRAQQAQQARDRALRELLSRTEVPVPDVSLQEELERRNNSVERQLESAGLTREQYLQAQGRDEEDFQAEVESGAEDAVRGGFLLDALARKEELGVEQEELSQHLMRIASQTGVQPEQLAQHLTESGRVGTLVSDVLRNKALDFLTGRAKIVDESGRQIDVEALREAEGSASSESAAGTAEEGGSVEGDEGDTAGGGATDSDASGGESGGEGQAPEATHLGDTGETPGEERRDESGSARVEG